MGKRASGKDAQHHVLITSAPKSAEEDLNRRQGQYFTMMSIRVVFFALAIAVPGPLRWVFLVCSAILPSIAVLVANAVDLRQKKAGTVPWEDPIDNQPEPEALGADIVVVEGEATPTQFGVVPSAIEPPTRAPD